MAGKTEELQTDLIILGAGMAGMSAAVFAANQGINTLVAGGAGAFEYASGLMDLWSLTDKAYCTNPWQGLNQVEKFWPDHPFLKIPTQDIAKAFDQIIRALEKKGLAYTGLADANTKVITAFGTIKPTYRIPVTMENNNFALVAKEPVLLLDIKGLREFRAKFVQQVLASSWKGLRIEAITFPGMEKRSETFTPLMAQCLEAEPTQDNFAAAIKPLLKNEHFLGLPAILGINNSKAIQNRLEQILGIKIFEIPTCPVSVSGIRLKETFKKVLEGSCVTMLPNQRILSAAHGPDGCFTLETDSSFGANGSIIRARRVLLATGRFLSKGLISDRNGVKESIFNLPVSQPGTRKEWHAKQYFDPKGHLINQAGVLTDDRLRPLGKNNLPVFENLYAAGSILAGQDWMRTRSGSGLSIATAFHAIHQIDG